MVKNSVGSASVTTWLVVFLLRVNSKVQKLQTLESSNSGTCELSFKFVIQIRNAVWTKEKVKEFADDIGYRHQSTSRELSSLHTILSVDEECYGMTEGMLKKVHVNKHSGYGIAVLTNQRFLFYHKGFLGSVTIEQFPIDTISSISFHKGMLLGSLHVYAANVDEVIIEPCDNKNAARIAQAWKHLSDIQRIFNEPIVEPATDATAELEKWHQLKEKGIITEEEFNSKKKQLLGL